MSFTLIIIVITCIISFTAFSNRELMMKYRLNPYLVIHNGEWYRVISYGFLHSDYMHLLFNMWALYFFGSTVEATFKGYFEEKAYLYLALMYLGALVVSVLATLQKHKNDTWYNSIGASGAVFAIMLSSIVLDPANDISLLFPPVEMPRFVFGILYTLYTLYMSRKGGDNINHDAHLFGALFGIACTLVLIPSSGQAFIQQIINWYEQSSLS